MKQANQPQQRFVQLVPSQVILAFQSWLPFAILGGVAGLRRNARSCSCTAVGKDFAANRGVESEFLPMALVSEEDFRRNARQFASQVHGHSRLFLPFPFVQDIQCIQFSYVLKYHDWLPWAFISCTRRCWLSGFKPGTAPGFCLVGDWQSVAGRGQGLISASMSLSFLQTTWWNLKLRSEEVLAFLMKVVSELMLLQVRI